MSGYARSRANRLRSIAALGWRCGVLRGSGRQSELPQTVYLGFRELGGIYVKFLQLLVLRLESFQKLREYDIYDIYDRVQTEPIDIRATLHQQLGARAQEVKLVGEVPFAAGSFGQVYRADYLGKAIIIKVLRPTVRRDLHFDLKILNTLSIFISWFAGDSAINIRRVCKEFARSIHSETNYLLEADYAATLYERHKYDERIVIPYTYRELSTETIICQDYVEGIAATELIEKARQGIDVERLVAEELGSDIKQQLVALGTEVLSGVFLYGATYGDPHPGNIKLMSNNRIGLIDYGLQAPAPRNMTTFHQLIEQYYKLYSGQPDLRGYSRVLLDMYGGDIIKAVHALDEYYGFGSNPLLDSLVERAQQIIKDHSEQTGYLIQNNRMTMLFNGIINKNNRFCLQYEIDGPELIRAAMLFVVLVTSLGVKNEVLRLTYAEVLTRTRGMLLPEPPATLQPDTALEILAGWFDQLSYKNPQLHRQISREGLLYV